MPDAGKNPSDALIDAALPHVAFDGWSEATFKAAVTESGIEETKARALVPRGAMDLALAFHARGDVAMADAMKVADLGDMRYRDKVAHAVRLRIEAAGEREAVRRGTTLFALPQNAALGAQAIWGTADAIWTALGDTSEDFNWYSKRATLAGVYSSTVLYWLGDESPGFADTWAFLDRRIDDVMTIEKVKAQVRDNAILKPLMAGPEWLMARVKAPAKWPRTDIPGVFTGPRPE
jgi:ubiquinone biosynthesis protein COQ9